LRASETLNLPLQKVEARASDDFFSRFGALAASGINGLILVQDSTLLNIAPTIAAATLQHRLPTVYDFSALPENGGLMSYGPQPTRPFSAAPRTMWTGS
jgi:putative tryptophan/tyrosine transport system substrate-binding protein